MNDKKEYYKPIPFKIGQKLVCICNGDWINAAETAKDVGPDFMEIVTVSGMDSSGIFLKEYKSLFNESYDPTGFMPAIQQYFPLTTYSKITKEVELVQN